VSLKHTFGLSLRPDDSTEDIRAKYYFRELPSSSIVFQPQRMGAVNNKGEGYNLRPKTPVNKSEGGSRHFQGGQRKKRKGTQNCTNNH